MMPKNELKTTTCKMANESHGTMTSVLAPFLFCQIFITWWKKTSCMFTPPNTIQIKVDLTSNFLSNLFNSSFIFILFIYKGKIHFKFNNFCSIWLENCERINMHNTPPPPPHQKPSSNTKSEAKGPHLGRVPGWSHPNKQTNTNLS
jgi:hypothetical protein